jgi:hypothetical protein
MPTNLLRHRHWEASPDDVLVIGYRPAHSSIWTFQPDFNLNRSRWSATVYIGYRGDTGKIFGLTYFLVQSSWANYLLNTFDEAASRQDTWWDAQSLPPSAISRHYQVVRRSAPKTAMPVG